MNAGEQKERLAYRKRYYDDEQRNKIPCKRPSPLIRKSKSIEQRELIALKKEVDTYRRLYLLEQQKQEQLLSELAREKNTARHYKMQLYTIKKCLLKSEYHK